MFLDGDAIIHERKHNRIIIEPFDEARVGPNSVDLTLGDELFVYDDRVLDPRVAPTGRTYTIPASGGMLEPGQFYLGATFEHAGSDTHLPCIEGRSSIARLGLHVHIAAGFGDRGFSTRWTLELVPTLPIIVYPGMAICQIYFGKIWTPWWRRLEAWCGGRPLRQYEGKYRHLATGPVPSRVYQDAWTQGEGKSGGA